MIWRTMMGLCGFGVLVLLWLYGVIGWPATGQGARVILPTEAPGPPHRILILGTSLTHGEAWVADLEAQLQDCAPDVTVTALARPGAASDWGAGALETHLAKAHYDLVVVEFTANDASLANGMPLIRSRALHETMIDQIRDRDMEVILATMSPAWGQNALERPGQRRYAGLYRDLAAEWGTGLIDTRADWQALPQSTRGTLVPDGLHPTGEGHGQITLPAFVAGLSPLVCAG